MNERQLLKLAQSGDKDAKYQLGRLAEDAGQIDEAKKWFHEAAAAGSPAAMNAIGLLAHTAGDLQRARNWYEKAANNGYSMALNNLGTISEDPEEALKWFDAGVKAGNSLAMFNLGLILLESGEEKQSLDLFLASAKLGDSNAMAQLGLLAEEADDLEEARSWYLRAAELENSQAMYNLGVLNHDQGDISEAKKWYESALQAGNLWPLNNLGRIAEAEGDVTTANSLYIKAAENGNPTAMTNLGIFAEESGNLSEAIKWYEQAAALDQEDAMFHLGKIASSTGDEDQARIWWEKAAAIGHQGSIDALEQNEENQINTDSVGDSNEQDDVEEMEFRNDDLRYPYMDYLSGDEEKIATIEDEDPELFQMFEELNSYEFLTLWGDWSMDFEHPFSYEAWEKVSYQLGFLIDDLEDEMSEEQLEQFGGYPRRLTVRHDFLPTNESPKYKFNIEGGECSISAKAPQLQPDSDNQGDDDLMSLKGHTGIDCDKHEDSKACYLNKCEANLITLTSGFGDGVYGVTCFDNWQGEIECVIAYFYHDHEYVENFIIANDFEAPGFIEGYVPFYLGRLASNGEFYFGDTASWREGRDEESWSLARVEVPADEYLVLGWIDPRTSFDRVFFVGLYRNVMKAYLEKVMDFYPATKTFADEHLDFARNLEDY
jgi:TPR repeat protein